MVKSGNGTGSKLSSYVNEKESLETNVRQEYYTLLCPPCCCEDRPEVLHRHISRMFMIVVIIVTGESSLFTAAFNVTLSIMVSMRL